ncbi:sideroflexin-4 isoform X2 [Hemicordylus capensis]|uniref:sideroflexin-4 isoform X2 n=1 Tax=Hemicordylus capensis TaxID=884348 RepID=UPI002302D707|nr:sideroflexin-4 isoform X2 [Hemicordylus capensis]
MPTLEKTFLQRFCHWLDILDPLLLFPSYVEIDKSRMLLETSRENITESLQDNKLKKAWKLSLASVHPGTGDIIPPMFRPPALMPFAAPLAFATFSLHRGVKQAFIWQFLFHSYTGAFSLANGNSTKMANEFLYKQLLPTTGTVLYSSCVGALPQYFLKRYKLYNPIAQVFFKTIVPGPLTALLCMMNVMVIRSTELVSGIEVVDSNGNVIGLSRKAGEKAVKETAWLRAALFGTAVFIPDIAEHYLKRTRILLRNPHALPLLRLIMTTVIIGTMIPVSFSWEPQVGKIQRSELESEIVSSTEETELFYYRGI